MTLRLTRPPCVSIARVCRSSRLFLAVLLLCLLVSSQMAPAQVSAGPVAYGLCQSAAATGCALTGVAFVACKQDSSLSAGQPRSPALMNDAHFELSILFPIVALTGYAAAQSACSAFLLLPTP